MRLCLAVWSRDAMAGHGGVVYLTITETSAQDTLTGITTPVATKADLHETINDHGVIKMRPLASLTLEGKPVTLAPETITSC
jgi:periplasmic copper chaperone A